MDTEGLEEVKSCTSDGFSKHGFKILGLVRITSQVPLALDLGSMDYSRWSRSQKAQDLKFPTAF